MVTCQSHKTWYYIVNTKERQRQKCLKNWRLISLLNNDYKIVTKALALHLEKVLPMIISPNQTGYVKGRYIGESIRIITDMMSFSKKKNIQGIAVFLDFEKALDSIKWSYLQKCLEVFNFGPQLRQCILVLQKAYRHVNKAGGKSLAKLLNRWKTRLKYQFKIYYNEVEVQKVKSFKVKKGHLRSLLWKKQLKRFALRRDFKMC